MLYAEVWDSRAVLFNISCPWDSSEELLKNRGFPRPQPRPINLNLWSGGPWHWLFFKSSPDDSKGQNHCVPEKDSKRGGRFLLLEDRIWGLRCLTDKPQSNRWSCLAVQPVPQSSRWKGPQMPSSLGVQVSWSEQQGRSSLHLRAVIRHSWTKAGGASGVHSPHQSLSE